MLEEMDVLTASGMGLGNRALVVTPADGLQLHARARVCCDSHATAAANVTCEQEHPDAKILTESNAATVRRWCPAGPAGSGAPLACASDSLSKMSPTDSAISVIAPWARAAGGTPSKLKT
eukprot:CAMPEP_0179050318 /NCGR_PEP_ID=MMETSP0796-20121207/20663_1 /TAXON_ID=73915 /ORGANISM="Pyrodinium bahamense, Strain pbaha01" /LENGTH=119 /DNA_ID=CAMNT_0020746815 /DNA_START=259 /DNA_END=616 /DNA_ORIENTATION=-